MLNAKQQRQEYRRKLCEAQNHQCCYCGTPFSEVPNDDRYPSIDHVVPLANGGTADWENEVMACRRCNAIRSDADAFYFFETGRTKVKAEVIGARVHHPFRRKEVKRKVKAVEEMRSWFLANGF